MQPKTELLSFVRSCLKAENKAQRSKTIEELSISKHTLRKIEIGEIKDPGSSKVEVLARYFGAEISFPAV